MQNTQYRSQTADSRRVLELDKILEMLCAHAACEQTKQLIRETAPATNIREAQKLIDETAAAHSLANRFGNPGIYRVVDCRELIGRARRQAMLSMGELLSIASVLRSARLIVNWKRQAGSEATALDTLFEALDYDHTLESDICEAIISEEEISDQASPELYDIRRRIKNAHQRAREQLERITRSSTYQKYLQEQIITIRNGRFVVPVRSEHRQEIKGLVHDTSSSGATLFIEPMAVVELNNQIRELEAAQQHEINRILLEFSGRCAERGEMVLSDVEAIIALDAIFARARLADQMRASVPILTESGETELKRARHPLIEAKKIVPIDIRIGGEFDTLVITGPNTGGKTVALKTLGLFTLMARCGLMLPCADESRVCFYPSVLADIGDEQSIEQSLSTFSGHMTNIVGILERADENTLVLIDELGAGTDPVEGAALAVAIISQLRRQGAKIAATTHYAEIKMYALQTEGVENASCEFDVATLRPTYRLLIGVPGRSNAFAISGRLGLPVNVIDAAREQVSTENTQFEDVVSGLEASRQELEREKEIAERYRLEAEQLRHEAKNIRQELEKRYQKEMEQASERARSLVEQVRFQSGQIMEELEALKKEKDKQNFSGDVTEAKSTLRRKMRELERSAKPVSEHKAETYRLPRKLKSGDVVYLQDFGTEGTVISPPDDKDYLTVRAGILTTKVPVGSVRLVDDSKRRVTKDGGYVSTKQVSSQSDRDLSTEIDLRGMDTIEAMIELDRGIDAAVLSNIKMITAIHGKGTGALRKAVHQRLRGHKSVRTYRLGTFGEGESGVTIIELK